MPPLAAALPAIGALGALGTAVGSIASMVKANSAEDKLSAQMDKTDKQRNDIFNSISGNQSNYSGVPGTGTSPTGLGSTGVPSTTTPQRSFSNNPGLGRLSGFGG